ncbi:MAG: PAS domain S-box protein [Bacteroidota bacterium]
MEFERQNKSFVNQIVRSEANLSALMDNSTVNIYSLDRSLRYIAFNTHLKQTIEKLFNVDIKIGDYALNVLPRALAGELQDIYAQALKGTSLRFVKEFVFNDEPFSFSFIINPIIEGDSITGLACFATDISGEKVTEKKLAKSEARFRALIENNFDSIAVSDETFTIMYASPSVARTLGHKPEDLVNTRNPIRFHSEDWDHVKSVFEKALANPNVPMSVVTRVQHKNGHYIWAEGIITNMLNNESVKGLVANYRDVTERKEAELQQTQMTGDLVQRNKDLEQFAYIVSHNLRGPVANILGISHILQESSASPEDRGTAMQGIFTATSKLDEVIMDLNRILDTKKEVNNRKENVSFQQVVDSITLSIQDIIEKNNCKIITDFTEVKTILTIRSFLQSIFYNLISNSIKYKQPNTDLVIRIVSHTIDDGVKLVFTDNGMGIDLKKDGSKVFGLYRRFHPKDAEGKGMGLFMVKDPGGNSWGCDQY